jgi:iron complex outermembrane recepter protein
MHRRQALPSRICLAAGLFIGLFASLSAAELKSRFDLPAESMAQSLRDFAVQANCNISYDPSAVADLQAPAIKGEFTAADALAKILMGTGLTVVSVNADTLRVVEKPRPTSRDADRRRETQAGDTVRLAYAAADVPSPTSNSSGSESASSDGKSKSADLEEITVTGTHIRGTKDSPAPVVIFTRDDIDAAGLNTVQQFLQTLPQNFGSASENTINAIAGNGQANNTVNGSAPNLRGLGADATLVLINGHRVAPGNSDGSFVDLSMIPLTAVDRIEIVTDGASAIYGSDAVGGVVNIILRKHYDGAETRAQIGSVTSGSMHNYQVGQTVGDDWSSGSALLTYQYFDQTPLSAGSRDYLHAVALPFTLLPEQVQHSAFANIDQQINAGLDVHGDFGYAHRSTYSAFSSDDPTYGYISTLDPSRVDNYSASLGATGRLPHDNQIDVTATYSESDTAQQGFQIPSPSPLQFALKTKAAITSLDANVDGVLAALPTGSLRYAIGGQYRRESFGNTFQYPATGDTFRPSRDIGAGYAELHVPVIGSGSRAVNAVPLLELTLADRGEHYSDFGSTNNPEVGAIWKSPADVALRGTWGTSFKAPLLSQLNPIPSEVLPLPGVLFNPAPGGTPNTLLIYGGNPDLRPEKATVWTIGLDFKPILIPGFTSKLTYYDIVFSDRIASPGAFFCSCNVFNESAIVGPSILERNPPASQVQQLIAFPTYDNLFNIDPSTIGAIFDARYDNLSTVKTRGLDFSLGYGTTLYGTRIDTGIDGTYIFTFDDQFTSSAPVASVRNTTYNPVDLRFRARAVVSRGAMSVGMYLNFTNAYTNINETPHTPISSWTTVDAVVSYDLSSLSPALNRASVALSVVNLADRNPPYVAGTPAGYPITYDGENANALGRYLSLRFQKRW